MPGLYSGNCGSESAEMIPVLLLESIKGTYTYVLLWNIRRNSLLAVMTLKNLDVFVHFYGCKTVIWTLMETRASCLMLHASTAYRHFFKDNKKYFLM